MAGSGAGPRTRGSNATNLGSFPSTISAYLEMTGRLGRNATWNEGKGKPANEIRKEPGLAGPFFSVYDGVQTMTERKRRM